MRFLNKILSLLFIPSVFQLNAQMQCGNHILLNQQSSNGLTNTLGKTSETGKILTATIYTIPVVFHVLHIGGSENISDAQIIDQMNILNRDYRKLNPDTINISPPFVPADAKIEFRLAALDTNGNCTSGITRHYDANSVNWAFEGASQYKYTWNPKRYLNIYVVKSIVGFQVGGYSSLPGYYANPAMDAIVMVNNSVGSIGTSNILRSRFLTHEVGHYFNLLHPWAQGGTYGISCGDDGVADTPITKGFSVCPSSPTAAAICNPPTQENYQNYMDYTTCRYMFTAGQVVRMTAALNSTVGGRSNLWTTPNLSLTGVLNPSVQCAPISQIYPISFTTCSGGSLTFYDGSFNGSVTNRTWSASGALAIPNSSSTPVSITFTATGLQTVSLTVSNGTGSSTDTKTVTVLNGAAQVAVNYPEGFENPGLPPNFIIINSDNDVTWTQTSLAAGTGSNSFFINGSSDPPNSMPDIIETPSYDFASDPTASFTFKYAYARANASNQDKFKVQGSKDCGGTWQDIYVPTNGALALNSGGTTNTPFFPSPSQFITYTLSDHPNFNTFAGQPNVKFRFYFKEDSISGYGNNIFLDDINFNSVNLAGINPNVSEFSFRVYPVPAKDVVTIEINSNVSTEVAYQVTNILGQVILQSSVQVPPGMSNIQICESRKLERGVYLIRISTQNQKIIRKLVMD